MRLDLFLSAFYSDEFEPIRLRVFPPRGSPGPTVTEKIIVTRAWLRSDRALQLRLINLNRSGGLYFVVNAGGDCDGDVTRFNAFFAEIDDRVIIEQHALLDRAPIRPAIRVETRKSVHAYWPIDGPCDVGEWRDLQLRLIGFFKSDPKIKNPSRVMRLPFFNHLSIDDAGGWIYKRVEIVEFDPARRFTLGDMLQAFPAITPQQPARMPIGQVLTGAFDIRRLAHSLHGYHETQRGWAYAKCPVHQGKGDNSLFISMTDGAYGCFDGCSSEEIRAVLGYPKKRGGLTVLVGGQLQPPQRPSKTIVIDPKPTRPVDTVVWELTEVQR